MASLIRLIYVILEPTGLSKPNHQERVVVDIAADESIHTLKQLVHESHWNEGELAGVSVEQLNIYKINQLVIIGADETLTLEDGSAFDIEPRTALSTGSKVSEEFSKPLAGTRLHFYVTVSSRPDSRMGQEIREAVAIFMRNHDQASYRDVRDNNITLNSKVISSIDELPPYAKVFVQMLREKVLYNESEAEDVNLAAILKHRLGPDGFERNFAARTTQNANVRTPTFDELVSYAGAPGSLALCNHSYWSAETRDGLTVFAIDIALRELDFFDRNKEHSYIPTKSPHTAVKTWAPRCAFRIASVDVQFDGTSFCYFHGETGSMGQSDDVAAMKNALISLHSRKVIEQLYEREDQVILSAYLSKDISAIYIFFKHDTTGKFVYQCILMETEIYWHVYKLVGFLRHMQNFAAWFRMNVSSTSDAKSDAMCAVMKIQPPQGDRETYSDGDGGRETQYSEPDFEDPDVRTSVIDAIAPLGFQKLAFQRNIIMTSDAFNHHYAVKKIRRGVELNILEHLKSISSSTSGHHIIPIKNVLPLGRDHALIIMPWYTVLGDLHSLTQDAYYQLRHQLVEAVAFLHAQGIAHCDIKPDNLVAELPMNAFCQLYVIDFGAAIWYSNGDQWCTGYCGTVGWTAPEIADGCRWDPQCADVWALARSLLSLAKLAEVVDPILEDVLLCGPSSRPTAEGLLSIILTHGKRKRSTSPVSTSKKLMDGGHIPL